MPDVGDGVAEEDYAILARRRRLEGGVGGAVAAEFAEIVAQRGLLGVAVFLQGLVRGEGWSRLLGPG
ncbi:MAG: hypothetical protein WBN74_09600 [Candidatus Sulfotelmatobacter sp.]